MTGPPSWRDSRAKRRQVAAIAAIAVPLIRLLSRTWRYRVHGQAHLDTLDAARTPFIVAFWHGRILPGMIHFRDRGIVVMTSENFDGEWIARIIRRFGFGAARGSSSRGGIKALVQLRNDMASGRSAAFTLDGPRGPREIAQPGAVWLARATGYPLLPFHVEANRCWTLKSWDLTQIPKPFATITLVIGEPMRVGPDEDVDAALARMQDVMGNLKGETTALMPGREADDVS